MNDGNTGYPWSQGDPLLAADLNAAIANSVALAGGMLPLNGSAPMTGPLTLSGNATLPLHAVPLQQLTAATAGGPFLPLATGGTVAGATSFANVSYNMLASGAVGDGVADDTAKIQAFLNTLSVGVEVILPANHQFLIDSADLTIPMGLTIQGQGGLESGGNLVGCAFILNPNCRIVVNSGTRLSNFKILRKGLLASPTTAQANAAVVAWAAEAPIYKTTTSTASGTVLPFSNTTGITVGMRASGENLGLNATVTAVVPNTSVTVSPIITYPVPQGAYVRFGNSVAVDIIAPTGQGGVSLDRMFILGFNCGIMCESGRIYIDTVEADCTTAMYVIHAGDAGYVSKVHCVPYYGGDWNKRPGPNYLIARADGWLFEECSSIGWVTGWVVGGVGGVTLQRCWSETIIDPGGIIVTTGLRVEGAVITEVTLNCCVMGGSVHYDFQNTTGLINAVGCYSASSMTADPTAIGHYRFGPQSSGAVLQPIIIAGIQTPFVVQAGIALWQVSSPCIAGLASNPMFTGAAADIAKISLIGGSIGAPLILQGAGGQPVTFNPSGGLINFGGGTNNVLSVTPGAAAATAITLTQSGTGGLWFGAGASMPIAAGTGQFNGAVTLGAGISFGSFLASPATDLSKHLMLHSAGYGINVIAATLQFITAGTVGGNCASGYLLGTTGLKAGDTTHNQITMTANAATSGASTISTSGTGGIQFLTQPLGFNSATPIAKPTLSGAWAGNTAGKALATLLASYGLLTDSSTA